ncbi:hypothetical protein GM31_16645 [Trabulsiella odontotermitis]|uniref:DNA-binding protein n=2 Tax=Trabulsiella odontotermitis TaxID=379893 RepID=A0A0L0GYK0_9ENTR|nr:hypothetical protein GM31_16645 [Trabulsiella odontotermitis]
MTNTAGLETVNGVLMMSSRSISEMTNKEHKQIVRDIKTMLEQLGIYSANLHHDESKGFFIAKKEYNGRIVIDEILLGQDLSTTLVTGYSVQDRYKIIKRWSELESGKATPLIAAQPAAGSADILSIARVVAEATASATMKVLREVTGTNLIAVAPALSSPVAPQITQSGGCDENAFIAVTKIAWLTAFSDSSCRRLIDYADLPVQKVPGVRGLMVHKECFMSAFKKLIEGSTPPHGKRKRWQHPEFGGFTLREDPKEIFGEGE